MAASWCEETQDLGDVPCIGVTCPLPLVDICASIIVPNVKAVQYAVENIPREVNFSLLRMAVLHEHFDSVKFLSVHWPFPLLDFKCLLHGYSLVPFEKLFSAEKSTLPNRLAASLATWLPEMRQHSNIQCLDLSSIDTDPDGTCSFAQASINSLGVCEEDVELLVGQILCRQIPFLSEPKGRTIRVNLCCTTDRYIGEAKALLIMDALTVKQYAPINLHCRGLIMTEDDLPSIVKFIDPLIVTHLEIDNCIDLLQIFNTILSLQSIKSLDLPDFGDSPIDTLAALLRSLPCLKRLNLMNTPLTSLIHRVLDGIQLPLEDLNLSNCRLEAADFNYLARSHHVQALKHLDIGSQRLDLHFEAFLKFLLKVSGHLVHLFTFDGHLSEAQIIRLIDTCKFPVLRHWVLVGCKFYHHSYPGLITGLAEIPKLQHVSFSLPKGMRPGNWVGSPDEWREAADHFKEEIKEFVQETCITFGRPRITVEISRF